MDKAEKLEASIFYAQRNGMLHSDFTKEDKNNVEIMMEYAQQVSREQDEEISQLKDIITSLEDGIVGRRINNGQI